MRPKIAIPVLHSQNPEYAQRALPQYLSAIEKSGGEAVVIALEQSSTEIARQLGVCQAVLLPGSRADVDPQKYNSEREPKTADADLPHDGADELLLHNGGNI